MPTARLAIFDIDSGLIGPNFTLRGLMLHLLPAQPCTGLGDEPCGFAHRCTIPHT